MSRSRALFLPFSSHRSHEFGSNIPEPFGKFDILCYDAVLGFNKSTKPPLGCRGFLDTEEASLPREAQSSCVSSCPQVVDKDERVWGSAFRPSKAGLCPTVVLGEGPALVFSPGRMCVITHGYQVFPAEGGREEETLIFTEDAEEVYYRSQDLVEHLVKERWGQL